MLPNLNFPYHEKHDLSSGTAVVQLYQSIRPHVKRLIYALEVIAWYGQENDTTEDAVQEAVIRTWLYWMRAARGETRPLDSAVGMGKKIARNHSIDKSRRDRRYVCFGQQARQSEDFLPYVRNGHADPFEMVIEKIFEETLLVMLPAEIVKFPTKQRQAILIDLAHCMDFDDEPTRLQRAFLEAGVQLQDYLEIQLPTDPVARNRHNALVNAAYKRLANLPCVKQYLDLVAA